MNQLVTSGFENGRNGVYKEKGEEEKDEVCGEFSGVVGPEIYDCKEL